MRSSVVSAQAPMLTTQKAKNARVYTAWRDQPRLCPDHCTSSGSTTANTINSSTQAAMKAGHAIQSRRVAMSFLSPRGLCRARRQGCVGVAAWLRPCSAGRVALSRAASVRLISIPRR
jgi:hypothetical protein